MGSRRLERLASQLVRELSDILRRKLGDPRLDWVTVTRAKISPDLRDANVYITTLQAGEPRDRALEALAHAHGYIRRELGQRLQLRVTPDVHFHEDEALAEAQRVHHLLTELKSEGEPPDG